MRSLFDLLEENPNPVQPLRRQLTWRDILDKREKYEAYLCSPEWGRLRAAVHERAGGVCERCYIAPIYAVHHLTYIRKYNERLEDLQGVCFECHEFIHGKAKRRGLCYAR